MFFDIPWQEIWNDIIDVLLYIPRRVWELVLKALSELLNAIPVPAWIDNIPSLFSGLPTGIPWAFWLFNVAAGIGIIVAAFILRFLIRRIPVIG